MGSRGEFDFIEHVKGIFGAIGERAIEGIGDDCAVMPLGDGSSLVFTTDMLTEGVHFICDAISASELGAKSLAVNLSDVAAMGAVPVASLLSIALPSQRNGLWADQFMDGYRALSERYGVALVGGDTTGSTSGVTINVVAIGRVRSENIKRRGAAQVGDRIFVGGALGESAAGLADVLSGDSATQLAKIHHNPLPQVEQGVWLGARECVHAMIDISDGLASDLTHILKMSHANAVVNLEAIPTSVDIQLAVCGGEDYKLLFTVSATDAAQLQADYLSHFGTQIYEVGQIIELDAESPAIIWQENGVRVSRDWSGYTHF